MSMKVFESSGAVLRTVNASTVGGGSVAIPIQAGLPQLHPSSVQSTPRTLSPLLSFHPVYLLPDSSWNSTRVKFRYHELFSGAYHLACFADMSPRQP